MKTLVVYCHPHPNSFTSQVRDAAVAGLLSAGHEVRCTDLYAEGFQPTLSAAERNAHFDPEQTAPDVVRHAQDLLWCESLVLVYPTWFSGQPAMMKGWFDRVWISGVAWNLPPGKNRLTPLLLNVTRIAVVTTHGSSKLINMLEGEAGKRLAFRSIRLMCNPRCRTKWIALYNMDHISQARRQKFLDRVSKGLSS